MIDKFTDDGGLKLIKPSPDYLTNDMRREMWRQKVPCVVGA